MRRLLARLRHWWWLRRLCHVSMDVYPAGLPPPLLPHERALKNKNGVLVITVSGAAVQFVLKSPRQIRGPIVVHPGDTFRVTFDPEEQ